MFRAFHRFLTAILGPALLLAIPAGAQPADADVEFAETSTGGHLIVVPSVSLPEAGFIALHDSTLVTQEDPFGSVIGVSSRLAAGTHTAVQVELGPVPGNDKPFTSGSHDTIIAMPHKDSNGNGRYDFITSQGADDGPFGGAHATPTFAGNIVIAAANVTRGSFTLVADQFTDGHTFEVAVVDLSEGGFVALHDATLVSAQDPFGSVIGSTGKLSAGLHRDVIALFGDKVAPGAKPGKLSETQTVIAMPHKDSNGNSRYDFVTSQGADDGPFAGAAQTFAGKIDIAQATATLQVPYGSAAPSGNGGDDDGDGDGDSDDGMATPGLAPGLLAAAVAALALALRRRSA